MSIKEKIEATEAFKNLDLFRQTTLMKRHNRLAVEHGYSVASHVGLEQFEKQTTYNKINFAIIREMISNEKG